MNPCKHWLYSAASVLTGLVWLYAMIVLIGYGAGYGGDRWSKWSNLGPAMSPSTAAMFLLLATAILFILEKLLLKHKANGNGCSTKSNRATC